MLDAVAKLVPSATRFLHQIAPSVVATLIAAGLISGYNHTFSAHVQQPRMAALHAGEETAAPAPAASTPAPAHPAPQATSTVPMTKPAAAPVTEIITIHERANEEREPEKEKKAEAGKDQTAIKVAMPLPPVRPVLPPRTEFKPEPRVVSLPSPAPAPVQMTVAPMAAPAPPRVAVPMAAAPMAQMPVAAAPLAPPPYVAPPVVVAGPAIVPAEPPPVVTGKPYVTVPDRPNQRPAYEATIDAPPPPQPQGPFGVIVNTLRPSSIFARMREFGDRIEATGNDILPSIRQ